MTQNDTLKATFIPGLGVWTYTVDPAVARIIKVEQDVYKAHWDSGQPDTLAVRVTLFDGTKVWAEKAAAGSKLLNIDGTLEWAGDYFINDPPESRVRVPFIDPTINATDDDVARVYARDAAERYFRRVRDFAVNALKIRPTESVVDVVKGRKVPKGRYEVTRHNLGQYGPYVDLRDVNGKEYKYVAVGNVVVVPDWFKVYSALPNVSSDEAAFLARIAESKFDPVAWETFAEWIEHIDALPPSIRELHRDEDGFTTIFAGHFAEVLRNYILGRDTAGELHGVRWNYVESEVAYYNEFRKTRY